MKQEYMEDVLRVLFTVAWMDGEMQPDEFEYLETFVSQTDVTGELEQLTEDWYDDPPDEPDWERIRNNEELAESLMRQSILIAAVDDTIQYDEMLLLERLRGALGVDERDFHRLQKEVEELVATHR